MFNNFGMHLTNIFKRAEQERYELKQPYVGTEHLLLSILALDKDSAKFFQEYNLTYELFKKELLIVVGTSNIQSEINLYTPMLKRVVSNAEVLAKENNNGKVLVKHLLLSLFEEGEGIAIRLLIGLGLDIDTLYENLNNVEKGKDKKLEIYETGIILNDVVDDNEVVVGRDKEIDLIIETLLRKKKNNPILIGDAGVGKTAIVEELVRRIKRKEVPDNLYNFKVVMLEMGSLVSGTKYRGEFEEKLTKIIKELEQNRDIILFIDEIHAMVNAGGAEGAITAGDIFKPALARGKIKCIGATTNYEYNKFFSHDLALMRRFEVVNIDEPNKEETKEILLKVKKEYEAHHFVKISEEVIDKVIMYADKFITNKKNPDKTIDFLDSICSKVVIENNKNDEKRKIYQELELLKRKKEECIKHNNYEEALNIYNKENILNKKISNYDKKKRRNISEDDIINVLERKTNFNFTKLEFLDNLKNTINNKLYGVDKCTEKIINLIKNNLENREGFLKVVLEGEEYLGKSTLIKVLAENYPMSNFLRIDLKEFKNSLDITKLIGTVQGYVGYNDEHLFSKLKNNKFSIILFDHYNDACKNIKDLIKEILKEKYIIDNRGDKICFNNTFIFITNDTFINNRVGFSNEFANNLESELETIVDDVVYFEKLKEDVLSNYLDYLKVDNKDYIIKNSDYEKYNYKNIDKLLKKEVIKN